MPRRRPGPGRRAAAPGPLDTGPIGGLDPAATFAALDPDLPLALLPVRIETRYTGPPQTGALLVRIWPDLIHADGHRPELTETEHQLGRAFWERTWRAGGVTADRDAAFAWLTDQVGPWRGAWVARALTPLNADRAPAAPVPDTAPLDPAPRFPAPGLLADGAPVAARLLPDRWVVVAIRGEETVGTWFGSPIADDVALAPGLADGEDVVDGPALLDAQGLEWTHDFDAAVAAGMALRIELGDVPGSDSFDELLVFGARTGDRHEELEALLTAHRYTHGLDLAPQGTPTNRTESAPPGVSPDRPDLAALRTAELDALPAGARPPLDGDGALYRMTGAAAACAALGLGRATALDLAPNAALADLPRAEAMNRALWAGTLGTYLDDLLARPLAAPDRAWLRDWFSSYVRGGGPLPTLLVGAQPYGLLPISDVRFGLAARTRIEQLETVLEQLRGRWDASLESVARLDHGVADVAPEDHDPGVLAATVSQILGAVPHPTGFRLRAVEPKRGEYVDAYNARLAGLRFQSLQLPDEHGDPYTDPDVNPAFQEYLALAADLGTTLTAGTQLSRLGQAFAGILGTGAQAAAWAALRAVVADELIPLVEAHVARVSPILFLPQDVPGITGKMGDPDDPAAFFAYHDAADEPWTLPLVAADDDLTELRAWLAAAAAAARAGDAGDDQPSEALPLLRQLVASSLAAAAGGEDAEPLADGLEVLGGVAEQDSPVDELERLMRETLGTAAYRLDAWYTGVAAWRLENKRAAKPHGVQVGAFGFVCDLHRRDGRGTQGYVLAPSLAHAATAAILRSGWSAFGGSESGSGLAVDLSSERIRRARWVIDGVRQGQDLGRLLGARLERRLHDAGLDAWVEPLRRAALDAVGDEAAPSAIVDGLLLARAYAPGAPDRTAAERAARHAVDALIGAPDAPPGDPAPVLAESAADLDAAADAAVAQSVFALAQGSLPEAAATLTAAGSGEVAFPRLSVADTPHEALTVTHRIVVLVDPDASSAWPGATTSGRALAAPGLEAWAAGMLGDSAGIPVSAQFADPDTGEPLSDPIDRRLADTGLAALDLVALGPAGQQIGLGRLGDVLSTWAAGLRPPEVPASASCVLLTGEGDRSLEDVVLVGRALRELLDGARDLDGRDLAAPGTPAPAAGLDIAELERRVAAVARALGSGRDRLAAALAQDGAPPLRAAMLALCGFDLPGAVPRTADAAEGATLLARVDDRVAADATLAAEQAAGWDGLDELARHDALAARLALLVGRSVPLAPRFVAANAGELDASVARARIAASPDATAWLAGAGRVDPGAGRLRAAVDLAEALAGTSLLEFAVAQLPDHPDEGWAALERPSSDARGRLCILLAGAPARFAPGAVAGIVVAGWNEAVPRPGQTAATAVHFDAASSRAAQAILLCVAENGEAFDLDLVRILVRRALQQARWRTVDTQTLSTLGQYLPATFLPGDLTPGSPP